MNRNLLDKPKRRILNTLEHHVRFVWLFKTNYRKVTVPNVTDFLHNNHI